MPRFNLKSKKKTLDDGRIQLTITVPATYTPTLVQTATIALAVDSHINIQNEEDPKKKVLDEVGEAQFQAFCNQYAMTTMAPYAVGDNKLEIIMEPETSSSQDLEAGKDYTFTAIVTLKPHYELTSYDPVEVTIPSVDVTDAEIDQQIYTIAERSAQTQADAGAEVTDGAEVSFKIETKDADDKEVPNLTADRRVYKLGEDFLPKEFDDNILGMKAGDSRTFDFDLPGAEGPNGEPGPSKKVTSTVTLEQINKKIVPAITDAWVEANMPQLKDVEGLRAEVKKQGINYKTQQLEDAKFALVASELAKRFKGSIADEIYEYTQSQQVQNIRQQLKAQGKSLEDWMKEQGIQEQQLSMELMLQTREILRQGFALDALARHMGLTVEEDDIQEALKRMAPGQEDKARQEIVGTGRAYMLTEAALRTKANIWLMDTATFKTEGAPATSAAPTAQAANDGKAAEKKPAAKKAPAKKAAAEKKPAAKKPAEKKATAEKKTADKDEK
jgi:trigger factor